MYRSPLVVYEYMNCLMYNNPFYLWSFLCSSQQFAAHTSQLHVCIQKQQRIELNQTDTKKKWIPYDWTVNSTQLEHLTDLYLACFMFICSVCSVVSEHWESSFVNLSSHLLIQSEWNSKLQFMEENNDE